MPAIEASLLREGELQVAFVQRECNWLQALEGDIDTSHFGFLHTGLPASMRPLKNGQMVPGSRLGFDFLPNTTDWYGRWRLTQNPSNDWMIDRAAQKTERYTGIASVHGQDQAVTESMGSPTMISRTSGRATS